MTLNNKLAFEIWVGIVVLVIVIGGIAGVILMIGNDATSSLTRTQVNNPTSTSKVTVTHELFASQDQIRDVAITVSSLVAP